MSRLEALLLCAPLLAACGDSGRPQDTANATLTTSGPGPTSTVDPTEGAVTDGTTTGEPTTSTTSTSGLPKLDLGAQPDQGEMATTGECAAQMLEPQVQSIGVDIVVVVDTSNSMQAAIAAVEASINNDFAAILGASNVDYRVIVMGDYPPGEQLDICISAPLSGTDCNPPPAVPAVTERYKHYDGITGSGGFLASILAWYTAPDPHGLAPNGYRDFLRDGTRKVILAMTDGTSASNTDADGDAFDAALLALDPPHFGTLARATTSSTPSSPWAPTTRPTPCGCRATRCRARATRSSGSASSAVVGASRCRRPTPSTSSSRRSPRTSS
ncbi:hypothetical protein [Nannocystis pusilla]|uniref:hypothetical protein n=1 Tax=Nannocystis pusilla TaxID=889268 RepID=UPI003B7C6A25